jgi:hypothetical protein
MSDCGNTPVRRGDQAESQRCSRTKLGRLIEGRWALLFIVLCISPERGFAAAIDCSPVKPNSGTDTSIEDNFKGHAQVILKSLGSGEIENGFKQAQADALSKYPNADQLLLWRSYIYIACALLQNSTQWNDDQKFEKLIQLIALYNKPPPADVSQKNTEAQNSLTGQSHGFAVQARCLRSGASIVCTATIVNQDPNREVMVWVARTKLYNASSQAYPATEATVAGYRGSGNEQVRAKLLQGAPAEAEFRFVGVPPSVSEFAELDIYAQVGFETFVLECAGNIQLR